MPSSLDVSIVQEITKLHNGIAQSLRRTVQDAIRIGELLTEAKEKLPHGEFIPWIQSELPFSRRTADNYRHLYEYRGKVATVATLQEAYRIVEQIETDDAQRKRRPAPEAVSEPTETIVDREPEAEPRPKAGVSPEEKEHLREFKKRMERQDAAAREEQARNRPASKEEVDDLLRRADAYAKELQEAAERFSHLTLSGGVDDAVQTGMLGLVRRYVQSFQPAARQVEVAHNLIKAIRLIIHEVNGEEASA